MGISLMEMDALRHVSWRRAGSATAGVAAPTRASQSAAMGASSERSSVTPPCRVVLLCATQTSGLEHTPTRQLRSAVTGFGQEQRCFSLFGADRPAFPRSLSNTFASEAHALLRGPLRNLPTSECAARPTSAGV